MSQESVIFPEESSCGWRIRSMACFLDSDRGVCVDSGPLTNVCGAHFSLQFFPNGKNKNHKDDDEETTPGHAEPGGRRPRRRWAGGRVHAATSA